jgi:hypothetical protein
MNDRAFPGFPVCVASILPPPWYGSTSFALPPEPPIVAGVGQFDGSEKFNCVLLVPAFVYTTIINKLTVSPIRDHAYSWLVIVVGGVPVQVRVPEYVAVG